MPVSNRAEVSYEPVSDDSRRGGDSENSNQKKLENSTEPDSSQTTMPATPTIEMRKMKIDPFRLEGLANSLAVTL